MTKTEFTKVLARLSVRRQAEVDESTYVVYAEDLMAKGVELEDLEAACNEIGLAERAEYQTAYPAIGDLLKACTEAKRSRERRAALLLPAPEPDVFQSMSQARAKLWLERIKYAGTHGAAAAAALPPLPPEGEDALPVQTFACPFCLDEPNGWIIIACPGHTAKCGRPKEHDPHHFGVKCVCWLRRHAEKIRQNSAKREEKGFGPSAGKLALEAVEQGRYEYAGIRTIIATPIPTESDDIPKDARQEWMEY